MLVLGYYVSRTREEESVQSLFGANSGCGETETDLDVIHIGKF